MVRLVVHDNAIGGKAAAQVRTARIAAALKGVLVEKGLEVTSIEAVAVGATQPLMPGTSGKALEANRRVVVTVVTAPELEAIAALPGAARVRVAGIDVPVNADGTFAGKVVVESDAVVTVELLAANGKSTLVSVPLFRGRPLDSVTDELPRGASPVLPGEGLLGEGPASLRLMLSQRSDDAGTPGFKDSLGVASAVDAVSGFATDLPAPPLFAPSGPARLLRPSGPARTELRPTESAFAAPIAVGHAAATGGRPKVTVPLVDAPVGVTAGELTVWLPAEGAALHTDRLAVRGRTAPTNLIRINGEVVPVADDGQFVRLVTLTGERAIVEITAEDLEGNLTRVSRQYRLPTSEWFVMALADGVVGWDRRLDGMNASTTFDSNSEGFNEYLPEELYLHGRAVGYLKGRVRGSALVAANPFAELRVTAHVDTGREAEADVLKQLVDPERYYPVYGDNAQEVQDVASRAKVYVLLEADKSRAIVGNFSTRIDGAELFRFQRSYFGASLDLDHPFVAGQRTEVHAFAASAQTGVRHRQLVLQGTGGSMYFLKDGEMVEGSERVELVVRDALTGMRLSAVPQARDVDYSISYREGRLIFSAPVASLVTSGFRLQQNAAHTLDGNPVFIEVEYDYTASLYDQGDEAYAFQVRQEFGERLRLGGGVITEDHSAAGGARYRLVGGDAQALLFSTMRINAELAFSQAEDADHLVSVDGGVTYGQLGSAARFADAQGNVRPEQVQGWAAKLQVAGDAGEFLTHAEALPKGGWLPYQVYAQFQDPYFYSGSTILEQGQAKLGGQLTARLDDHDSVRVRHDGVWSQLFLATEERHVNRQLTTVGYEHLGQSYKVGAEVGHTYWDDAMRIVNTDVVSAFGEQKLLPRLTVMAEQELAVRADERIVSEWQDRFTTSVGGKYELGEGLYLTATEALRWSGANSAQAGLKTHLGDGFSVYASERMLTQDGRTVATSVVGGESTAIPGSRSYAEYQVDSLASGRSGRAVIGMDNHWTVAEGLSLKLSYERAQLTGHGTGAVVGPLGYAVDERSVSGYGSTAVGRTQQFSASGYSSAGTFPVGVSSRDAFATGLEYARNQNLKAGARFEMRYDRGDAALGAHDRLVVFGEAGGDYRLDRYLVTLLRVRGATVQNLDYKEQASSSWGFAEGQFCDVSAGVALRPVATDLLNGLLKWTRRYERRALNPELSQFQLEIADVLSIEDVVEVGLGFDFANKLAIKWAEVRDAELPRVRATTILALARLGYHLSESFESGVEYRWLGNLLTEESEHGALVELAWLPVPYAAVGVGYNFTRFSDDLLADPTRNHHGYFFRVTGRY